MSCVSTKRIVTSFSTCDRPYRSKPDVLSKGEFGTTRIACCHDDCRFIEKYQERGLEEKLDEDDEDEVTVQQEIDYQYLASEYGLAPRIMEIHTCTKGTTILMERLDGTLRADLDLLSHHQIKKFHHTALTTIHAYLKRLPKRISGAMKETVAYVESMIEALPDVQTVPVMIRFQRDVFVSLYKLFPKEPLWSDIPAPFNKIPFSERSTAIPTWIPEDSDEQQRDRILRMALVVRLIKRLQRPPPFGPALCHNDAHADNIMRRGTDINDPATTYEFIDFGLTMPLEEDYLDKDFDTIRNSVVSDRVHLAYLLPWMDRLYHVVTAYTTDEQLREAAFYEKVWTSM